MENLETTKRTATEIEEKVKEAKITEVKINEARELYRPAAARASLLYFILNDLNKISPMYQFSLKVSIRRVRLYWSESERESDIASKSVHRESNLMLTCSKKKKSLSLSINEL